MRLVPSVVRNAVANRRARRPGADRYLTTMLVTDIVDSTRAVAALGDERWHAVLDEHDALFQRSFDPFGGQQVRHTGDGVLATFASCTSAVRSACSAMTALRAIGVEVRAGVHAGEVEARGDDIGGVAVCIASRICDCAEPGEVLVSHIAKAAAAGSELQFADRGEHALKGIADPWRLYAATSAAS
jgi:class 3 adenylate cyclase